MNTTTNPSRRRDLRAFGSGGGLTVLLGALSLAVLLLAAASPPSSNAAFPGTNGKIAFNTIDSEFEIYVANPDGSGRTDLTNNAANDQSAHWSPDGQKIAFVSDRDGDLEVWVMNADGTGLVKLTDGGTNSPSGWSPDGETILFSSNRDGNTEIYVMNADGTNQTRLTSDPAADLEAVYSPDGTKIAFTSYRDGNGDVWVMNADGSNPTNLTSNPAHDGSPDWSPDGATIVFGSHRDDASLMELYLINADGTDPSRLTYTSTANEQWPTFSPDGLQIAYARVVPGDENENDIYVMNRDGTDQRSVTTGHTNDIGPDWQPIDATPPTISITAPVLGATYTLGSVELADYFCEDQTGGSGVVSCAGDVPDGSPIDTASIGSKSFTVTASDNSGNSAGLTHAYSVVYDFAGFFSPVDNTPVFNVAKAGSAIPVKFSLNGDQGPGIFAAGYPASQQVVCDTSATLDGVEETVTAGSSSLSYDPTIDQYTYVWKTSKAWASTCRQLVVKLADGTSHRANFKFK